MEHAKEWRTSPYNESGDTWSNPTKVFIDGKAHQIRNNCDYRVILDCVLALNDDDLSDEDKLRCALYIFYNDISAIDNLNEAVKQMLHVIRGGKESKSSSSGNELRVMDWEYDFDIIAPAIGHMLGYEVRDSEKYTHWYTWLGAYQELRDCTFTTVVTIRSKRGKGKALDKGEMEYMRTHREIVELPQKISKEEQELLDSEW